jgi:periplasmic mercuric ion binding protein
LLSTEINKLFFPDLLILTKTMFGMKKLILLAVAVIGISTVSSAQAKKYVQTVTIKTPTVQCESCKKRIEEYLKREDGVQKSVVDFKKKTTKVTFVSERTNIENIKTAIANAGYDADDVTADTEAYKALPKCCKKPEDGGGSESH